MNDGSPTEAPKRNTVSVHVMAKSLGGWQHGLVWHPKFQRWMAPGGHLEAGESLADAAVREVAEETGLRIDLMDAPGLPLPYGYEFPASPRPWWIVELPAFSPDSHTLPYTIVDHAFVGMAPSGTPESAGEHEFRWFASGALPGLAMFSDLRKIALAASAYLA